MTFRALTFAFMTEFRLQRINVPAYYPMNSIIKNQLEVYVVGVSCFIIHEIMIGMRVWVHQLRHISDPISFRLNTIIAEFFVTFS